jgi:hypothetical protein
VTMNYSYDKICQSPAIVLLCMMVIIYIYYITDINWTLFCVLHSRI